MRDFESLLVWQRARRLAVDLHRNTTQEAFIGPASLRSQLLRSVASIPTNIAEGCGKRTEAEFARFLDIALGSAKEAEHHVLFAVDIGAMPPEEGDVTRQELTEIRRMLFAFARAVRARAG